MSEPNYLIVDGALGDYIQEVSAYIDQLSGVSEGQDGLEKVTADLLANESPENQEKAFKAIADRSHVLAEAPEKEFEAAYNLVLYILTNSNKIEEFLPTLLSNLTQQQPKGANASVVVLSVLTNLFNILPSNSTARYTVFETILNFAQSTNNLHMLMSQLKLLPKWLDQWGVDSEQKKKMFIRIGDILASIDGDSSYKCLYDAALESESPEVATKLLQVALTNDHIYDFDQLRALSSVESLQGTDIYKLMDVVSNGRVTELSSVKIDESVDKAVVEKKCKVIAIADLVSKSSSKTISYAELAKGADLPQEDAELWLIDAIRAGLIEGRLCQMEEQFDIHRATPIGEFGIDEWKQIQQRLNDWKAGLKDVLDVVRNAHENASKDKQQKLKQQQQQQQQKESQQQQQAQAQSQPQVTA